MDVFASMLPERMFGHPDGMIFETVQNDGSPSVVIKTGPVMERTMRGMRYAIAALASQGSDIVVDDVMMRGAEADEYRVLLTGTNLRFIGLFAPLNVLERRELARGDRQLGLARWQLDRVHRGQKYDLEIETSGSTPMQIAERICGTFSL